MRQSIALVGAVLFLAAGLVGCSSPTESAAVVGSGAADGTFAGPWAELFASTFEESMSDVEREALSDGDISGQEYVFFQDQILQCLASFDVEGEFLSDKSFEYSKPAGIEQDVIDKCMVENGIKILTLRDAIERNPSRLDEGEIMVKCLQRADLVDAGYTTTDLMNSVGIEAIIEDPDFKSCESDPIHFKMP